MIIRAAVGAAVLPFTVHTPLLIVWLRAAVPTRIPLGSLPASSCTPAAARSTSLAGGVSPPRGVMLRHGHSLVMHKTRLRGQPVG